MPPVAPLMPRKMLPPPTTIAISTLRSANASPESLSTTRRYLLSDISRSSRAPAGGSLLADLDAREAANRGIAAEPRYERPHRRFLVLDERLLDECTTGVGLVEAVELALDDLGPSLLGLAFLARLGLVDLALALDLVGWNVVAGDPARRRARDVQRHVVRDLSRLRR